MTSDSTPKQTGHIGPILFANEIARGQLVEEGEVVTFRTRDRTTGETWWRKTRTGPKCGDVVVEHITALTPTPSDLHPYADDSGFASARHWSDTIREMYDHLPTGHLYRVTER